LVFVWNYDSLVKDISIGWFSDFVDYTLGVSLTKKYPMNIKLEELFEKYELSLWDRHEIRQIFRFVAPEKKQKILDNFEAIALDFSQLEQELVLEQEVLLGKTLHHIESRVSELQKKKLKNLTSELLTDFKETL